MLNITFEEAPGKKSTQLNPGQKTRVRTDVASVAPKKVLPMFLA